MEDQQYLDKMKEIHDNLIQFIDAEDDHQTDEFLIFFKNSNFHQNRNELKVILYLILKISNHHHRKPNFFTKIEQILNQIQDEIKQNFSTNDLLDIFKSNKRVLLFLIKSGMVQIDEKSLCILKDNLYFLPEIEKFYNKKVVNSFRGELCYRMNVKFNELTFDGYFEEKRQKGENDNYICELIQNDSVEEFITYVSRNIIPLSSKIKSSIFETNPLLIAKNPTLIEYSVFFGSIQIFRYLYQNEVKLTSSLWVYAVHGRNPEIIHFLEENIVDTSYRIGFNLINESIKCHHFELTDYFINQYNSKENQEIIDSINEIGLKYLNFHYCQNKFNHYAMFYYECKYNLIEILEFLSKNDIEIEFNPSNSKYSSYWISNMSFNDTRWSSRHRKRTPLQVAFDQNNFDVYNIFLKNKKWVEKTFSSETFLSCNKIIKITIPSFITSIGYRDFYCCYSLEEITIPSSVKIIQSLAFCSCSKLKRVTFELPSSLIKISNSAFKSCCSLNQIEIPSSVTRIEDHAFYDCSSLTRISIPSSTALIEESAFSECSSLTQITIEIPSSMTTIEKNVFSGCSSLTQITIPSSITSIGDSAFRECSSLTQITIPSSVKVLKENSFKKCSSLSQVSFESPSLNYIENNAFSECSSLEKIAIPSCIQNIGCYSFYCCQKLKQVLFESNSQLININDHAFSNCSSLEQIDIPITVSKFGDYIFKNCLLLKKITIPPHVLIIPRNAFSECSSLEEITIHSCVISINDYAFKNCSSLKTITIPTSVTKIGNLVFKNCSSLIKIEIPSSVTSFGKGVFEGCKSLMQIFIPSSISIDNTEKINPNVKILTV